MEESKDSIDATATTKQPAPKLKKKKNKEKPPAVQYKRRARVYERIKNRGGGGGKSRLATVPEDQAVHARDKQFRLFVNPRVVGLVLLCFLVLAGIKEMVTGIHQRITHSTRLKDQQREELRRRKDERDSLDDAPQQQQEGDQHDTESLDVVTVPVELSHLANVWDPLLPSDRAFFWHIPRSGGASIKDVTAHCFGLLLATEAGARDKNPHQLRIITDLRGGKYVNVDVSTPEGIEAATRLETQNLPGLNVIATPHLFEASQKLFTPHYRGRLFALFRHPIERAASMYHVLINSGDSSVSSSSSLEDYAKSDRAERNWMTHFLTNTPDQQELTATDLAVAKRVLRDKAVVGLLRHKGESLRRFELYFGWKLNGEKMEECHAQILDWNWPNKNKHPPVREGSEAWKLLKLINHLDLELYHYAEELFHEQEHLFK